MCVKAMKREIAVRTMPNVRGGELPWSESGNMIESESYSEERLWLHESDDAVACRAAGFRMFPSFSRMVLADADGNQIRFS